MRPLVATFEADGALPVASDDAVGDTLSDADTTPPVESTNAAEGELAVLPDALEEAWKAVGLTDSVTIVPDEAPEGASTKTLLESAAAVGETDSLEMLPVDATLDAGESELLSARAVEALVESVAVG